MRKELIRTSKFLSLVLRHAPDRIGLTLDEAGWADVDDLLERAGAAGHEMSRDVLLEVVATNDKKRFALSPDGTRIRASQGHSVAVDLGLEPSSPPERLFHGTAERHLEAIRSGGLRPISRQHVHLSEDEETARRVGGRQGRPVVVTVRARAMESEGGSFYLSENGVWLTDHVPSRFLEIPQ